MILRIQKPSIPSVLEFIREVGGVYFPNDGYEDFRHDLNGEINSQINCILGNTFFKAYHFSRVLEIEKILQEGLKPRTLQFFEQQILPLILKQFSPVESKVILKEQKRNVNDTEFFDSSQIQMCFTTDNKFSYADGGSRFWETFGGEYTLALIKSSGIENGLSKLTGIGEPYVFELEVQYSKTNLTCRSQVINMLIDHIYYPDFSNDFPEGFVRETIIPLKAVKLN